MSFPDHIRTCLALLIFPAWLMSEASDDSMKILRDFSKPNAAIPWPSQNDGVMGGISEGRAEIRGSSLHFFGTISLANNGGFAQVYSPSESSDFSSYTGIRLRVKGDGRTYQFRIVTDDRFRGSRIAYRADFSTEAGQWTEHSLPFDSFVPSYRGRVLTGPELDLRSVRQIAFLLADGKPGDFNLEVEWIGLE